VKKNKLYLYLARLDRRGVEILVGFPYGNKVYATRIKDISSLNMNPEVSSKVSAAARDKRMTHELFAESAESFESLKDSLRERGYTRLPLHQFTGYSRPTSVNEKALSTKKSTMLRRKGG
jgi:hypothetical protein